MASFTKKHFFFNRFCSGPQSSPPTLGRAPTRWSPVRSRPRRPPWSWSRTCSCSPSSGWTAWCRARWGVRCGSWHGKACHPCPGETGKPLLWSLWDHCSELDAGDFQTMPCWCCYHWARMPTTSSCCDESGGGAVAASIAHAEAGLPGSSDPPMGTVIRRSFETCQTFHDVNSCRTDLATWLLHWPTCCTSRCSWGKSGTLNDRLLSEPARKRKLEEIESGDWARCRLCFRGAEICKWRFENRSTSNAKTIRTCY